jgi:hypothetical protein
MSKQIPTKFNVSVLMMRDVNEPHPVLWPVCHGGHEGGKGFHVGGLCDLPATLDVSEIGEAAQAVYAQCGVAHVSRILITPDMEWREWLNGFQPEEGEVRYGGGHSTECEGPYLMTE